MSRWVLFESSPVFHRRSYTGIFSQSGMFNQSSWNHSHLLIGDRPLLPVLSVTTMGETCEGNALTHWGRVAHCICVSKVTIIGSGNGLAPGRHQALIWISAVVFLIGAKCSEIWIKIHTFSFENVVCEIAVLLSRPQCVNGSPCFKHDRTTPHTITINLLHHETIDVWWWTGLTGTSHHYKQ